MVILDPRAVGAVDWNLQEVGTQAVAVGVVVSKQSGLQHLIGAGFNSRNQMRRRERRLFNLSEIVRRVLIQSESADWDQREIFL